MNRYYVELELRFADGTRNAFFNIHAYSEEQIREMFKECVIRAIGAPEDVGG
jgi:hypothetical protein